MRRLLPPPALPILALLAGVAACAESAAGPGAGMRVDTVAAGFDRPVAVASDASGLLVAEQAGRVRRPGGEVALDLRASVPADLNFVGGLLNLLAVGERRFVFLTTPAGHVLVAEARGAGLDTLVLARELRVQHHGGGLAWWNGALLVAFGDGDSGDGRGPGLAGKLVRVDPATRRLDTLAVGLRNPFRIALQGSRLWIADAGDRTAEEVNALDLPPPAGARVDFGWGIAEGRTCRGADCAGVTWPVYAYPTGKDCSTVVGAAVWEGRFWFADYCEGWIRSVGSDGTVRHHVDLDDRIVALGTPVPGGPPHVVTQGGAVLRLVRDP